MLDCSGTVGENDDVSETTGMSEDLDSAAVRAVLTEDENEECTCGCRLNLSSREPAGCSLLPKVLSTAELST